MMKNRAPGVGFPAKREMGELGSTISATRLCVLFEFEGEAGHGNGTSGKIYGSVDRDSTDDLPMIG